MDRISNLSQHETLLSAMLRNQQRLALAQIQVSTGKRGDSYDDFGADAVRQFRLSNLLPREDAYAANARRAVGELAAQDLNIGRLRSAALDLRRAVLGALSSGEAQGLRAAADAAFSTISGALNAEYAGRLLFGGGLAGKPAFNASGLNDLVTRPAGNDPFQNGQIIRKVDVGHGQALVTGFTADRIGRPAVDALRQLGTLLPIQGTLTAAQTTNLKQLLPLLDAAIATATTAQAENGARAAGADKAVAAADARVTSFKTALSRIEDVNSAEAISRLRAEQTALQASYQVFARLNKLTLLNFL